MTSPLPPVTPTPCRFPGRRALELRDFVEHILAPLHWVGADGTIFWANQAELDLLGTAREEYEEYIARHIAEFHLDGQVIDDMMPVKNGWDFRQEQKKDPELAAIPVVAASAVGKLLDVEIRLRKPLDYDELVRAVERYVDRP